MSGKILIVDDSRTIRQQVSFTLSRGGYQVVEATDGLMGLEALKVGPDISLAICDVNMPKMTGLELLEQAKFLGLKQPIVMLTTEGGGKLINRAKKGGAKGWLVKPFKPDQLLNVVSKLKS